MALVVLSAFMASVANGFNLYPAMDAHSFATALGISDDCLTALNNTIDCDQTMFPMAGSVDDYLWQQDDLTTLCTSDCTTAAKNWNNDVVAKCRGQEINNYGVMVPVDTVAGRYVEGLNLACLKSSNQSFCMLESQVWVGSDTMDCSNTNSSSCDPNDPQNSRIANLYGDDTLCSDCFVSMLHQRLSSPYLPNTDHSDYLVEQIQDIADVCTTTFPPLTTRAPPSYSAAPTSAPTGLSSSNITMSNGTLTNSSCDGQIIPDNHLQRRGYPYGQYKPSQPFYARDVVGKRFAARGTTVNNNTSAPANLSSTCDQLSMSYGIASGDLLDASEAGDCSDLCGQCLPAKCTLKKVPKDTSCDAMAELISTATFNVTTYNFLMWNPNVMGLCDELEEGQYVCAAPPGGAYTPIDSPLGGGNSSTTFVRGGGDGTTSSDGSSNSPGSNSGTPSASPGSTASSKGPANTSTGSPTLGSGTSPAPSAPSQTQSGIPKSCSSYKQANKGDGCQSFAKTNSISEADLYKLNPVLGDGGKACDTQFWTGYFYCVKG